MDFTDAFERFVASAEFSFVIKLVISLLAGLLIGSERESRGKAAGISTHTFVIAGSMTFTVLSVMMDAGSPGRIAAQIVSGIGFLGAGIILKRQEGQIINLTTAASIWFSSSLGMLIGIGWYKAALCAVIFAVIVFKMPSKNITPDKSVSRRDALLSDKE